MKKIIIFATVFVMTFSGLTLATNKKQVFIRYYPDGNILSRQIYYSNGAHKGPDRFYWDNGKLRLEYFYKGGMVSKTLRWDENGQPITNTSSVINS